ncbi:hypothetical protein [Nocardia cyriacigeorgica]|uniref:hypothetical protein n=2 Tax=Nocardia cyriacigeorgica TaxID=135487 RepID=UPI002455CA7B|nr:hypothetical protein [Nocardia cyriacigeorgica]
MEQVYDAHLYVANWGTHRVMFRLPCDLLDPGVVEGYCVGDGVDAWVSGEFVILDFASEDEAGEFDFDYDPAALLSAIIGVRAELAAGDLRPLYLAGLAACGAWEREEDLFDRDADNDLEPPVPPGLGSLTASQRALADFLRIDADLLAVAAQASAPLEQSSDDLEDLPAWLTHLPAAEKDRFLARVAQGEAARVRMELLRRFRGEATAAVPARTRRTVADLLDNAARRRAEHERRAAEKRAEAQARAEHARSVARERRLDRLAGTQDLAWSRGEAMIATRKPAEYDAAITLLNSLRPPRSGRSPLPRPKCDGQVDDVISQLAIRL